MLDISTKKRSNRWPRLFIGTTVLFLFLSLRWKTGCDWEPYYDLFKDVRKYSELAEIYHFDYGYLLENYTVKLISDNYTVLLLFNSSIIFSLLYYILKSESQYPNISLFFFYCIYFPIHFMGGNRRAVAIVCSLLFICYLYKRKNIKGLLLLAIGILFHKSAIFCLLAYIIPRNLYSRKKIIFILSFSLFLGLTGFVTKIIEIIGDVMGVGSAVDILLFYSNSGEGADYAKEVHSFASSIIGFIKRLIVLLFVYYGQRYHKIDLKDAFWVNLYLISIIIYMAFAEAGVLQVISVYFAIFEILIFAKFLLYYNKQLRPSLLLIFMIYGFLQLLNNLNAHPELYIPYKSILSI